uniref:Uncharacterized protein n=1 Tax=Rhizophora mucronata TaxID=61149 RepID=A0A2P2PTY6_RHIMU
MHAYVLIHNLGHLCRPFLIFY